MTTAAKRLRRARQHAGYESAAAFARAAAVPEVTYRAHEIGPPAKGGRGLSESTARAYGAALGVDWVWLLTGQGDPPAAGPAGPSAPGPHHPVAAAGRRIDIPAPASMSRDVPLRGIAVAGDDGAFEFNGEIVDYVRRPPGIAAAKNAFAIYVDGDSMVPRFDAGELVFVHPDKPPVNGCDVLIELHGHDGQPGPCFIKRLVKRTPTRIVLEQFNPPRDDIEFPHDEVRVVYRILTSSELMGV